MSEEMWWYAARGAGLLTWAVAVLSVILGLLMSTKALGKRPGFPYLLDLHRFTGGLSLAFLAIHMITLWIHSYEGVSFGPMELLVPFTSSWRSGAVAAGVIAFYLMVAIELSSLVRDRIPKRVWHGIHLLSYLVVILGSVHGWQAGTDVRSPVVVAVGLAALVVLIGLTLLRVVILRRPPARIGPADRAAMLAAARARPPVGVAPSLVERWIDAASRR